MHWCGRSNHMRDIAYILLSPGQLTSNVTRDELNANEGGWFGSSIVFQHDTMVMLLYCIGESVCYWLEKGNSMDTWRRRTHNTWRWRTTLIKSERCYWMTASLYRKYNTFSDCESEQQHRTMTFAELPNHPLLLTLVCLIRYLYIFVNCVSPFYLTFQCHFNNYFQTTPSYSIATAEMSVESARRWKKLVQ